MLQNLFLKKIRKLLIVSLRLKAMNIYLPKIEIIPDI